MILNLVSCNNSPNKYFSETVKITLRNVGHQLLVLNQDLTSPVKPIKKINDTTYELSFPNTLEVEPDKLVDLIRINFKKANLPEDYIVEVFQCIDNEVAYSYLMKKEIQEGIIPCSNRILGKSCYTIQVNFTEIPTNYAKAKSFNYSYILILLLLFLIFGFLFFRNKKILGKQAENEENIIKISNYHFLPKRHILIKDSKEINLSKKECDLLLILVENLNQTVKREELTKKVWEDNGVVVSRSLDTYISKLRKKLSDDRAIKIANIHGVGYKLIVS